MDADRSTWSLAARLTSCEFAFNTMFERMVTRSGKRTGHRSVGVVGAGFPLRIMLLCISSMRSSTIDGSRSTPNWMGS